MALPQVSVLMPVYNMGTGNGRKLLEKAIQGIIDQRYGNWELVVVDDGSTDKTPDILTSFRDSRIGVVTLPENGGLVSALNIGLSLCDNELVARHDSDDWSHPDRLLKQVGFMSLNPDTAALGSAITLLHDGHPTQNNCGYPLSYQDIRVFAKDWCPMAHGSVMFRKSRVIEVGGYDGGQEVLYAEDYDLWTKLLRFEVRNLPDSLYSYYVNPDGVSQKNLKRQEQSAENVRARYRTYAHFPA